MQMIGLLSGLAGVLADDELRKARQLAPRTSFPGRYILNELDQASHEALSPASAKGC